MGNDTYPTKEDLKQRAILGDPVASLSVPARQIETGGMAHRPAKGPTSSRGSRKISAVLLKLAARMGADPDKLAAKYPDDTVRRTKYPVVEEAQPDGSILYKQIPVK